MKTTNIIKVKNFIVSDNGGSDADDNIPHEQFI